MLSIEHTAIELLKIALTLEPEVRLLGNIRAGEVARLAASLCTSCPKCGAKPWVNIACDVCLLASALEQRSPLTQAEEAALYAASSQETLNEVCDKIKADRGGKFPPDWRERVMKSGLIKHMDRLAYDHNEPLP